MVRTITLTLFTIVIIHVVGSWGCRVASGRRKFIETYGILHMYVLPPILLAAVRPFFVFDEIDAGDNSVDNVAPITVMLPLCSVPSEQPIYDCRVLDSTSLNAVTSYQGPDPDYRIRRKRFPRRCLRKDSNRATPGVLKPLLKMIANK